MKQEKLRINLQNSTGHLDPKAGVDLVYAPTLTKAGIQRLALEVYGFRTVADFVRCALLFIEKERPPLGTRYEPKR